MNFLPPPWSSTKPDECEAVRLVFVYTKVRLGPRRIATHSRSECDLVRGRRDEIINISCKKLVIYAGVENFPRYWMKWEAADVERRLDKIIDCVRFHNSVNELKVLGLENIGLADYLVGKRDSLLVTWYAVRNSKHPFDVKDNRSIYNPIAFRCWPVELLEEIISSSLSQNKCFLCRTINRLKQQIEISGKGWQKSLLSIMALRPFFLERKSKATLEPKSWGESKASLEPCRTKPKWLYS